MVEGMMGEGTIVSRRNKVKKGVKGEEGKIRLVVYPSYWERIRRSTNVLVMHTPTYTCSLFHSITLRQTQTRMQACAEWG